MPIKFRCQHCRQFLGISRSKAGQLVDCPTCGRTLRVPNLDGSIEPIPEPKLNVNELADALGELAKIGDENADDSSQSDEQDATAPKPQPIQVKELAPLPRPEPISVEAPLPAVAVDIHEDARARHRQAVAETPAKAVAPAMASRGEKSAQSGLLQALKKPPVLAGVVGGVLLLVLVIWLVGRENSSVPSNNNQAGNGTSTPGKTKPPVKGVKTLSPEHWKVAFRGQITYIDNGTAKPDEGARVLALPENRAGDTLLDVEGLWAGAPLADFRVVAAGLQALGGNAALVDSNGNFEIKLPPDAGTFHIIAISKFRKEEIERALDPATRKVLAKFFKQPDALTHQLAYHHNTRRFAGEDAQTWNCEFD